MKRRPPRPRHVPIIYQEDPFEEQFEPIGTLADFLGRDRRFPFADEILLGLALARAREYERVCRQLGLPLRHELFAHNGEWKWRGNERNGADLPELMGEDAAAEYVGPISVSTFRRAVEACRMPQPASVVEGRRVWLREELDSWLLSRPGPMKRLTARRQDPEKPAT